MSAYSKSCFITLGYKGHYIHSHYDSDLKAEVVRVAGCGNPVLPRHDLAGGAVGDHQACEGAEP